MTAATLDPISNTAEPTTEASKPNLEHRKKKVVTVQLSIFSNDNPFISVDFHRQNTPGVTRFYRGYMDPTPASFLRVTRIMRHIGREIVDGAK